MVRGLAAADRQRWDDWLSREMLDARMACGEDFEANYDRAPVWRFFLSRGGAWMGGAMAPSVDGVGRRFPIIAALCGDIGDDAAALCEERIYEGFDLGWKVDELFDALNSTQVGGSAVKCEERWWTLGNDEYPDAMLLGEYPEGLLRMMITGGDMQGWAN